MSKLNEDTIKALKIAGLTTTEQIDEGLNKAKRKKFRVFGTGYVNYHCDIEAETDEEAWDIARNGNINWVEDGISDNVELDEYIEEVTDDD